MLVIVGDHDHDQRSAEELATVLPNARFIRVVGNHWTTLTSPEFASTLVGFFTSSQDDPDA